jgi:hypothetical protein
MNSLLSIQAAALLLLSPPQQYEQISVPVEIGQGGTLCIEAQQASAPLPEKNSMELADGEKGEVKITFEEPGTFIYRLYQPANEDPLIHLDPAVYILKVIAGNEGRIENVLLRKEGSDEKSARVSWHNSVKKQAAVTGDRNYIREYAVSSLAALLIAAVLFRIGGGSDETV